jgi:hypothetical protein
MHRGADARSAAARSLSGFLLSRDPKGPPQCQLFMPPSPHAAPCPVPAELPVAHLSVSSLQRFWRCPEQWGRHYLRRGRAQDAEDCARFGRRPSHGAPLRLAARRIEAQAVRGPRGVPSRLRPRLARPARARPAQGGARRADGAAHLRRAGAAALPRLRLVSELEPVGVAEVECRHELRYSGAHWSLLAHHDLVTAEGRSSI